MSAAAPRWDVLRRLHGSYTWDLCRVGLLYRLDPHADVRALAPRPPMGSWGWRGSRAGVVLDRCLVFRRSTGGLDPQAAQASLGIVVAAGGAAGGLAAWRSAAPSSQLTGAVSGSFSDVRGERQAVRVVPPRIW